jgi:hypothetical protein
MSLQYANTNEYAFASLGNAINASRDARCRRRIEPDRGLQVIPTALLRALRE